MGAPMRPESATVIESRNLLAVGGEGDGTGGGIWLYEAVNDTADGGHGAHIYDPRSADVGLRRVERPRLRAQHRHASSAFRTMRTSSRASGRSPSTTSRAR